MRRSAKTGFLGVAIAIILSGCSSFSASNVASEESEGQDELTKVLAASAKRAAQARVELSKYQPVHTEPDVVASARPKMAATSLIDIDYVGPAENAARIVANNLGWEFKMDGKKRMDRIVSLRHRGVDAISILNDIGVQCGKNCDVHAQVVEGGTSSVSFSFRD